jgi:hypothetical protein
MRIDRVGLSETLQIRVPSGFSAALSKAASRDFSNASEFARRAIIRALRETGVDLGRDGPASDQRQTFRQI